MSCKVREIKALLGSRSATASVLLSRLPVVGGIPRVGAIGQHLGPVEHPAVVGIGIQRIALAAIQQAERAGGES